MTSADHPLTIDCGPHGTRIAAVVCRHLLNSKDRYVGFVENSDEPNDLQAWCDKCEQLYLQEGDMTAAFREFNDMAIVCDYCYAEIKARNLVAGLGQPHGA